MWRAAWSPDGSRVASVGEDGACRLWNASTGIEELKLTHDDPLWWVQWSHDGSKVATGSSFSSLGVWDAKDGKRIKEFKTLSQPMRAPIGIPAADAPFCFLQNNTQISYMARDTGFELLDLKTGQVTSIGQVEVPGGNRQTAAWSKDFKLLGIYDGYREFHLFGAAETKPVISIRYFTTPHWLADGRRILGGDNSTAWISGFDLRRKRRLGVLMPELPDNAWATLSSDGYFVGSENIGDHVAIVALHKDGRLLTLSPAEFQEQYGWKNDPKKVKFLQ